jgi:hypothetical protein
MNAALKTEALILLQLAVRLLKQDQLMYPRGPNPHLKNTVLVDINQGMLHGISILKAHPPTLEPITPQNLVGLQVIQRQLYIPRRR